MNTEATHNQNEVLSIGVRLRNAREQLGFSQQAVAERLCLKVSTIRDIEEDRVPTDLASTFLRGYIRSYAKLVYLSEDELLPMIEKQEAVQVTQAPRITSVQSCSLRKYRKKHDVWLMIFTWVVLCVVIGLTGAWWWQNYKVQQQEIGMIIDQSSGKVNGSSDNGSQSVSLSRDRGCSVSGELVE